MSAPPVDLVVHATHEAGHKVGGIGAVLDGLLSEPAYNESVRRTILIGLFNPSDPLELERLLAPQNALLVLYSGRDEISSVPEDLARALEWIELYFHVHLLYGKRRFGEFEHEVLLVDPTKAVAATADDFKRFLWSRYRIDSRRYETVDEYERFIGAAEPSYAALQALVGQGPHPRPPMVRALGAGRQVLLAHEWLGLPLTFAARRHAGRAYRLAFYAHEVATVRSLVENDPGHDTRFYNVMEAARPDGLFLEEVFGDQTAYFKHALLMAAAELDGFLAVSDVTMQELRFLAPQFTRRPISLVYNGVPSPAVTLQQKSASKARLVQYAQNLLGYRPTWIFSHVTRLVKSKGLWRDLRVLEALDRYLVDRGETAVLFTLSSAIPKGREAQDVLSWEQEYGWPVVHSPGNGDLQGPEVEYYDELEMFNRSARAVRVVLVNQYGWTSDRCGTRMPPDMEPFDIRLGTDLEFGQSIYEPFGIGQLEPLASGALCCISSVCGCTGFIQEAEGTESPSILQADYVTLPTRLRGGSLAEMLLIGAKTRERVEAGEAARVASEIDSRLPRTGEAARRLLESGQALSKRMSWRVVVEKGLLPALTELLAVPASPSEAGTV